MPDKELLQPLFDKLDTIIDDFVRDYSSELTEPRSPRKDTDYSVFDAEPRFHSDFKTSIDVPHDVGPTPDEPTVSHRQADFERTRDQGPDDRTSVERGKLDPEGRTPKLPWYRVAYDADKEGKPPYAPVRRVPRWRDTGRWEGLSGLLKRGLFGLDPYGKAMVHTPRENALPSLQEYISMKKVVNEFVDINFNRHILINESMETPDFINTLKDRIKGTITDFFTQEYGKIVSSKQESDKLTKEMASQLNKRIEVIRQLREKQAELEKELNVLRGKLQLDPGNKQIEKQERSTASEIRDTARREREEKRKLTDAMPKTPEKRVALAQAANVDPNDVEQLSQDLPPAKTQSPLLAQRLQAAAKTTEPKAAKTTEPKATKTTEPKATKTTEPKATKTKPAARSKTPNIIELRDNWFDHDGEGNYSLKFIDKPILASKRDEAKEFAKDILLRFHDGMKGYKFTSPDAWRNRNRIEKILSNITGTDVEVPENILDQLFDILGWRLYRNTSPKRNKDFKNAMDVLKGKKPESSLNPAVPTKQRPISSDEVDERFKKGRTSPPFDDDDDESVI